MQDTPKASFFYADDGLEASADPGWLQSAFDMLTGIFDRVGLWKKFCKTVGIVCRPCQADRLQEGEAYTQQMTGEGRIFKERQ